MTLRIVQVGVGPSGIGATWLKAIQESPDWTLVGVVDTVAEHRAVAAERTGLPPEHCFEDIAAAVQALAPDAVAVVVSSPFHALLCTQALQAGVNVVVEKPFTTEFADARALADLAEQRGLRLMVDQNYRYLRDMRLLRQAIQEGYPAGLPREPESILLTFDCMWPPRPYQSGMANTMLLEMAVHHFDALRFILGSEVRTVAAQSWRPAWSIYAGDTWVNAQFQFNNGVRVAYQGSLESPGAWSPWPGVWRIACRHDTLHLADLGEGYGVYLSRDPDQIERVPLSEDGPTDPGGAIRGTLVEFAAALREGRRPQSDARDNLRTLAMAFAISRSSAEGRTVNVEDEFFGDMGSKPA